MATATSTSSSEAEAVESRPRRRAESRRRGCSEKSLGPDGSLEVVARQPLVRRRATTRGDFGALALVSYDNTWRNRERIERDVGGSDHARREQVANDQPGVDDRRARISGLSLSVGSRDRDEHLLLRNTEDESALATRTTNNFQLADGQQLRDYDHSLRATRAVGQPDSRPSRDRPGYAQELASSSTASGSTGSRSIGTSSDSTARHRHPERDQVLGRRSRRSRDRRAAADGDSPLELGGRLSLQFLEDEVDSSGWDLMKPVTFQHVDVEISGGQDVSEKGAKLYARRSSVSARRRATAIRRF